MGVALNEIKNCPQPNITYKGFLDKVVLVVCLVCVSVLFSAVIFSCIHNYKNHAYILLIPVVVTCFFQLYFIVYAYIDERPYEIAAFISNYIVLAVYIITIAIGEKTNVRIIVLPLIIVEVMILTPFLYRILRKYSMYKVPLLRVVGRDKQHQYVLRLINWFKCVLVLDLQYSIILEFFDIPIRVYHWKFNVTVFTWIINILTEISLLCLAYAVIRWKKFYLVSIFAICSLVTPIYIFYQSIYSIFEFKDFTPPLDYPRMLPMINLLVASFFLINRIAVLTFLELMRWNFDVDIQGYLFEKDKHTDSSTNNLLPSENIVALNESSYSVYRNENNLSPSDTGYSTFENQEQSLDYIGHDEAVTSDTSYDPLDGRKNSVP